MLFIRRFIQNPRSVGAVAPSSKWLASAMVAPMAWPAGRVGAAHIVELGPGTGSFTRAIAERLGPDDRFLGVELEPIFVDTLRQRWPRMEFVCASAESLRALLSERGLGPVDHIVSGLPFATLPADTTERIVEAIAHALRPGGTFTTFHYLQSYGIPPAVAFRRQMTSALASTPSMRFVARNLWPALALTWVQRTSSLNP